MPHKKIALLDRHGETFTEGDNFKQYAMGFLKKGLEVFQLDPYTINFETGFGRVYRLNSNGKTLGKTKYTEEKDINSFDIIMDMSDIVSLNFSKNLSKVETLHINDPLAMYSSADKRTYVKKYSEFIPKTIVSGNVNDLEKALHETFGGTMIVKDPFGSCGNGIEKIDSTDPDYMKTLQKITMNGKHSIVAQKFMALANKGSKRVAVIGKINEPETYKIIHFYGRKPVDGEWKDNLSQGGSVVEFDDIREDEKALCLGVARKSGLYIMGLDIMDDFDEEGNIVPRLVETNSVLALAKGRYPEKLNQVVDFIVGDVLK